MDEGTRLLTYDPGYAGSPVSASLPVDGHPKPANTWLDNLITDNPDQRAAFAAEHGCTDDPYDLLGHIGEDTAGAISLSRVEDPNWPTPILRPVTDDAIALSIAKLSSHDYTPTPHIDHRFSLGGQQPKLALARISGRWFAANWAAPSTHIFKPATSRHRYLNALEAATCSSLPAQDSFLRHQQKCSPSRAKTRSSPNVGTEKSTQTSLLSPSPLKTSAKPSASSVKTTGNIKLTWRP